MVRATHRTTFEITVEDRLTPRGDCIVAVSASKGLRDLGEDLKSIIRAGGDVAVLIVAGRAWDMALGFGDRGLGLSDPGRIIVRRSSYTSPSTLAIRSDKAAAHLSRDLVEELRKGAEAEIYVVASQEPGEARSRALEILRARAPCP